MSRGDRFQHDQIVDRAQNGQRQGGAQQPGQVASAVGWDRLRVCDGNDGGQGDRHDKNSAPLRGWNFMRRASVGPGERVTTEQRLRERDQPEGDGCRTDREKKRDRFHVTCTSSWKPWDRQIHPFAQRLLDAARSDLEFSRSGGEETSVLVLRQPDARLKLKSLFPAFEAKEPHADGDDAGKSDGACEQDRKDRLDRSISSRPRPRGRPQPR